MVEQKIANLLDEMWRDYLKLNPVAKQIVELLKGRGEEVINDHIALRTYNLKKICMGRLARPFLEGGYRKGGEYRFQQKKLFSEHFEHEDPRLPKVFISELLVGEFPGPIQDIIRGLVEQVEESLLGQEDFLYSGRPWKIDSQTYKKLLEVSEYAAWMAAFGFRPNHFTVNVNALKTFKSLEEVNQFLKGQGIPLNMSGGEVKGSEGDLLKQSSTMANQMTVDFSDKTMVIPSCYYEFAQRFTGPDGNLYQGFVAASADKIFESTDRTLK